jgi:hypothetical protein
MVTALAVLFVITKCVTVDGICVPGIVDGEVKLFVSVEPGLELPPLEVDEPELTLSRAEPAEGLEPKEPVGATLRRSAARTFDPELVSIKASPKIDLKTIFDMQPPDKLMRPRYSNPNLTTIIIPY